MVFRTHIIYGPFMATGMCGMLFIVGNPTRFAPIPNPAPERALMPRLGLYKSKREKVAAAINPIRTTSSMLICLFGNMNAAIATTSPSIIYFNIRTKTSLKSNELFIFILANILYHVVSFYGGSMDN